MPRVKFPTNYQGSGDGASSSRAPPPKRPRLSPMERRKQTIAKKRIHPERGLDLVALRQTFVPGVVEAFGWQQVAAQQLSYNAKVVREFYTNCAREAFLVSGRVTVEDREVVITPARINEFYGLPDVEVLEDGIPPLPEVELNDALASALRVNGSPLWGRDGKIKQAELHFNAAFWNVFSSHSAQPTRHTSDIAIKRSRLVYCLMNSRPFNLGMVIHREIAERSVGAKGILPFPGLITALCREAGVQLDHRHHFPADSLIGHTSYNAVIHHRRGIHRLFRNGDFKPLLPDPEPEPEQEDEEERLAEETDAAEEFPQDQMFDIDRDLPPRAPVGRAEPGPSEAGPSRDHQHPTPSPPPPAQSSSSELLQQILAGINRIEVNQQVTDGRLTELEARMAEQQAAIEQRAADHQAYLEQRLTAHSASITAAVAQLQTLQQQQYAQHQQSLHEVQQNAQQVETSIGQIWSAGILVSDRIRAFEVAIEDYHRLDPLRQFYRNRAERRYQAELNRLAEEQAAEQRRQAARQRQAAEQAEQNQFDPYMPPPEDIPEYHPLD